MCAFITFKTQEAKERIAKWRIKKNEDGTNNKDCILDRKFEIFDEELRFEAAPEPSDIIWENLEIKKFSKAKN